MTKSIISIIIFVQFLMAPYDIKAQSNTAITNNQTLENTILELDKKFWEAYNSCDVKVLTDFLTKDLEFYHDKVGLTSGLESMLSLVKSGVCNNKDFRLRREAVPGTVSVYPIKNYGAILSGEHVFYANETGKPEKLIEKAKFTHLWRSENNTWKMARVLSYDHQPFSINSIIEEIEIPETILSEYTGEYQAPQTGLVVISKNENHLAIKAGNMKATLFAESETVFFTKEAPLRFTFIKNSKGKTTKIEVRENGNLVEEAKKIQ